MTDPTFEEGPFFLVVGTTASNLDKKAIVWASDGTTAQQVYGRLFFYSAYTYPEDLGDLNGVKKRFRLTPAQVADLHREGYLKL